MILSEYGVYPFLDFLEIQAPKLTSQGGGYDKKTYFIFPNGNQLNYVILESLMSKPTARAAHALLYLLCSFLTFSTTFSQSSLGIVGTSSDLTTCGVPDTFRISLQNPGTDTLQNINVFLGLAEGVEYLSNSVSGVGVVQQSNPAPDSVFLTTGDLLPFQSIDFYFLAQAGCAANDSSANSNFVRVLHSLGADSLDSDPFSILRPALAIQSITPSSFQDSVNTTYTRCITLVNGGLGDLSSFFLAIETDTSALSYSNFRISPSNTPLTPVYSGDSILLSFGAAELMLAGDLDDSLELNETIEVCYDITMLTCGDNLSQVHAYWGCQNEICEVQSRFANSIVNLLPPRLEISRSFVRNVCYGAGQSIAQLVVENTGTGPATEIEYRIYTVNNVFSSWDTTRIELIDTAGNVQLLNPISAITPATSGFLTCLGPNYVREFRVLVPFLDVGDTDTLRFYMDDCCRDWCPNSTVTTQLSYFQTFYTGRCDTMDYVYGTSFSGSNYGRVISHAVSGPSDLQPGDTATYCVEHSNFRFYNGSSANPGWAEAELILPPGVSYTGLPGDLYFEDIQGDVKSPTQVTVSGDTVRGIFPFPWTGITLEKVQLKIRVVTDCAGPCDGGPNEIQFNLYQVADSTCSCRMNISCYSWPVNVHCGVCNCPNGGMIFTGFDVYRTNLGLPDNDDNGIPDISGVLDTANIRLNYVMFGDTLNTVFQGVVDTTAANPFWNLGYAVSRISGGDHISPITQDITIFDNSTGNTYTCALPPPLVTPEAGDTVSFAHSFDTTILAGCIPPGFLFEVDDSVVINANYQVTNNIGSSIRTQGMENRFGFLDPISMDTAACDSFSGTFVLVGYYHTFASRNRFYTAYCNQRLISENYYLSIGTCCSNYAGGNIFKNEYRHWGIMDQILFVLPPTYNFVSATLEHRRTAGSGLTSATNVPLTPDGFSGDTIIFDMDSLWAINGGPIPMGDDGHYGIFRAVVEPTCQAAAQEERAYYVFDFQPIDQLTGPNSYITRRVDFDYLNQNEAQLELLPLLPNVPGIEETVSWDFQMSNNSISFDATNSWMSIVSPSGNVIPILVEDLDANMVLSTVNGIYQLGDVAINTTRNFRITANYLSCDLDSLIIYSGWDCDGYPTATQPDACILDSSIIFVDPQPSDLQGSLAISSGNVDICDSIVVDVTVVSAQVGEIGDIEVNFLLPLSAGLNYRMGSGLMEYPNGGGFVSIPDPIIAGTQLSWDINALSALIAANDLPGTIQPDSNSINLRFVLETNCNFISGQRFAMQITGSRPCGDLLPQVLQFSDPININGVAQPYSTVVDGSIIENANCPMGQTVGVSLINGGAGTSTSTDSLFVDLNHGYSYAGNFAGGTNPPSPSAPTIQVFPSGTRLSWPMPVGIVPGDTVSFTFEVDISDQVSCGLDFATISSVVNTNLFCARTNMNCNAGSQTGSFILNIPINRPDLDLTGFASTLAPVTGGYEYDYSGTVENNGVDILPGNTTTVEFYCDSDNNGVFSAADVLLGNYQTTVGISTASPHVFSGTLAIPNINCSDTNLILAVIVPDPAGGFCLCDTAIANTNVVLPVTWLSLQAEALETNNRVDWEVDLLPGHDYFVVERQENRLWQSISNRLSGSGTRYHHLHANPEQHEAYRIRSVDVNGVWSLSKVVEVIREEALTCSVYPNPAHGSVTLSGPAGTRYKVMDLYGKTILQGVIGDEPSELDLVEVAAGIYYIDFRSGSTQQVEKLVVE